MQAAFSAAQITELTKALTNIPMGRLATAAKTAERFQRFLAQRIGEDRAATAAPLILQGETLDIARELLEAVLAVRQPAETADWSPTAPEPARKEREPARTRARRTDLEADASTGKLPPPPDFSAPTHARFRSKLGQITSMAEAGDLDGLRALKINPVSSSPKALARYRDLCVIAIAARVGAAA